MHQGNRVVAIIAAGGSGKRMDTSIPKQFLEIDGEPILCKTVETFVRNKKVDKIYIIAPKDYKEHCKKILEGYFSAENLEKIQEIVVGGKERQDSIYYGLQVIAKREKHKFYVLIHDGARPFVTENLIEKVINKTIEVGAVVLGIPVTDSIRQIQDGKTVTLNRGSLIAIQTPQGFDGSMLLQAYEKAMIEGYYGTDDAELMQRYGKSVSVIQGDPANKKITTRSDLPRANAEVAARSDLPLPNAETVARSDLPRPNAEAAARSDLPLPKMGTELPTRNNLPRIGQGYDVHQLVKGRELILGGVKVPFEKGLMGHSDADVLVHAVMDSLLGAAALGDIGSHFPDEDFSYEGISSIKLLQRVKTILNDQGFVVGNIDATVICQRPKLAYYIDDMRENIASTLEISKDKVSVKATTTEKLGFEGKGLGISAQSVGIIYKKGENNETF